MDTKAILARQGWLGDGHSLHPSGRGIKNPLLVSRKSNVLGVGKKAHDSYADQWWARAFENTLASLKAGTGIGKEENKRSPQAPRAPLTNLDTSKSRESHADGLYQTFVKGEGLHGTIAAKGLMEDLKLPNGHPKNKARSENEIYRHSRKEYVSSRKSRTKSRAEFRHTSIPSPQDGQCTETIAQRKQLYRPVSSNTTSEKEVIIQPAEDRNTGQKVMYRSLCYEESPMQDDSRAMARIMASSQADDKYKFHPVQNFSKKIHKRKRENRLRKSSSKMLASGTNVSKNVETSKPSKERKKRRMPRGFGSQI